MLNDLETQGMEMAVEPENADYPKTYGTILAIIRKRRWFLWGIIFDYIPASVTPLQFTQSLKRMGFLSLIWSVSRRISEAGS